MAENKGRGRGGKLARSEIARVRLDPKLLFTAELAAAKERRTLSSFIEWAVERAVQEVALGVDYNNQETAASVADAVWDVDEADRFVNLASRYPSLLTHDEMRKWKFIQERPEFWVSKKGRKLNRPVVRAAWGLIDEYITEREPFDWNRFATLADEHGFIFVSQEEEDDLDIPF